MLPPGVIHIRVTAHHAYVRVETGIPAASGTLVFIKKKKKTISVCSLDSSSGDGHITGVIQIVFFGCYRHVMHPAVTKSACAVNASRRGTNPKARVLE